MALFNRAAQRTSTTGTGAITLGAALEAAAVVPQPAWQTFTNAGATDSTVVRYLIHDGAAWEYGPGTVGGSGTTLTRPGTAMDGSVAGQRSSTGALLNLSGSAVVFIAAVAEDLTGGAATQAFGTIVVSGQSNVVADAAPDTLTLVAGTGITITTDAGTDTITFNTSITQYTDELAQDAVGNILVDSSTIDLTYNDVTPSITAALIPGGITSLANLTTIQGLTITFSDAGFDVVSGWDDSAGAHKNFLLADILTEASPAAGDFLLAYGAEGDLRKVNWSSLPAGGGGGASNPTSAVFAHKNGTDQTISTATSTKITFGTENFDVGSEFASSTLTIATTGYYIIEANVFLQEMGSSVTSIRLWLHKNGAAHLVLHELDVSITGMNIGTLNGSALLSLAATDTIEIFLENVGFVSGQTVVDGLASVTWFSSHRITGSGDVTGPTSSTDNAVARFDGTTGRLIQNSGVIIDDSNNVTGVVALSATTIELGHASDTTLARVGAGDISVEGNTVYRVGGTDVALADGGTGASLADPGADRIIAWDDSAGTVKFSALADLNTEAAPAAGDFLLAYVAEDALVKINWSSLPGGGSTQAFGTIVVSGQSDVVADAAPDTLTLVAGTNITITTNASTDTITISASGGGGGINNVVEDTTPELGGDLESNNFDIKMEQFSADAVPADLYFQKSRNAAIGSHTVVQSGDDLGRILFQGSDGTNFETAAAIVAEVDTTPGNDDMPGRLSFHTTADAGVTLTERMRIGNGGHTSIGYAGASQLHDGTAVVLNVAGNGNNDWIAEIRGYGDHATGTEWIISKTRGAAPQTHAAVQANNQIGALVFRASDGDQFVNAAEIRVAVDGTPGDNDMPGVLQFSTTADGANTLTERMRINATGKVIIANTVFSAGGFDATFSDATFDVVFGWDDSAGTYKSLLLADIGTEGAPASGDFLLMYGAEGDLRKVNWSSLPGAGGGINNVVEDTTPQLGGPLDINGQYLEVLSANTNTVANIKMRHTTSGTAAAGIGLGLQFEVETATTPNYEIGAVIEAVTTDVTDTSEDFDLVFRRMGAGAAAAESVRFSGAPSSTSISLSGSGKGLGYTGTRLYLGQDGGGQFFFDAGGGNVSLYTEAANILAQRDSTNAQSLRVYNTFTDTSNYERAKIAWNTNVLEIGAEAAGSGTLRGVEFFGSSHTFDVSGTDYVFIGGNQVVVGNGKGFGFASGAPSGGFDVAMHRNAAGVIEVNNGTAGTFRDLRVRNVIDDNGTIYSNIPQNSQSAAYTLVLTDANKHILHPSADTTARTFTIPANGSVAFPIGTTVTFVNQNSAGVVTIAITTDTLRLAGAGTTGSRTLAANGVATAVKLTSTEWIISGTGLT